MRIRRTEENIHRLKSFCNKFSYAESHEFEPVFGQRKKDSVNHAFIKDSFFWPALLQRGVNRQLEKLRADNLQVHPPINIKVEDIYEWMYI